MRRFLKSNNSGSVPAPPTTTIASAPNILSILPAEIHLEIAAHLPISARLAYSLTCRYTRALLFRHGRLNITNAFFHIGQNGAAFPDFVDIPGVEWQRQLFLSYVERDEFARTLFASRKENVVGRVLGIASGGARRRRSSIWCSNCFVYHPIQLFTEGMLRGWRHERKCIGAEGKMWLCPHTRLNYQSTQAGRGSVGACCDDNVHFSRVDANGVTIWLPVKVFSPEWHCDRSSNKSPSYEKLKELMKQRDLRICPHLKMSDRWVYEAAAEMKGVQIGLGDRTLRKAETSAMNSLKKIEKTLLLVKRDKRLDQRGVRGCRECDASWEFVLDDMAVSLVVYRPFNETHEITHPSWCKQLALPSDLEELEREWVADAEKWERNPPSWPGDRPAPLWRSDRDFLRGGVLSPSQ